MAALGTAVAQSSGTAAPAALPYLPKSSLSLTQWAAWKVNAMRRSGHRADRARPALQQGQHPGFRSR